MKIAFRVDASHTTGSGHVMRCMTLAGALRQRGADCVFVSRRHPGHLVDFVGRAGYRVLELPAPQVDPASESGERSDHGRDWALDAAETTAALGEEVLDWLVVDHYGLDMRWEDALRPRLRRLMVIDDLANRPHSCELLLDQNLVEGLESRYAGKVPAHCALLLGPAHALLRPEFGQLRADSLARRRTGSLERLLVFMGGSDADDDTARMLRGVAKVRRPWAGIDVIVGGGYQHLAGLQALVAELPGARLHVQTPDMARLMAAADLAITAGGSVTWEKCALGLPSIVVIQSDDQFPIATMMNARGAQRTLGWASDLDADDVALALDEMSPEALAAMGAVARTVCDGNGVNSVLKAIGVDDDV